MADDLQSKAAELMRKVFTVGAGAFFLTEESLRGLVSEFKLPKELLGAILDSTAKTREEFFKSFSQEIMKTVLEKVDLQELIQKLGESNEIELKVTINLKPKNKKNQK